jgi:hypothetical protein
MAIPCNCSKIFRVLFKRPSTQLGPTAQNKAGPDFLGPFPPVIKTRIPADDCRESQF